MKVKVKRFDKNLPLPEHKTLGAAGMDVMARETTVIEKGKIGYIPLNFAIKIPQGYFLLLAARGSTHKLGIMPANAIGIGDSDFCGDGDEYKLAALNITDHDVTIEKGTRVAQILLIKFEHMDLQEIEKLNGPDRGGFGTTGHK